MRQGTSTRLVGKRFNHTTTMTILVVVVCLAIGYVSWVFFQYVGEIYLGVTERAIFELKHRQLENVLSNVVREIDRIREDELSKYQQMLDDRLYLMHYGSEFTQEQFTTFFARLFGNNTDWTAMLWNRVTGEVLHHQGVSMRGDLVEQLLSYRTFEYGDLVGLWGVSKVLLADKTEHGIKEKIETFSFANGVQVTILSDLLVQVNPESDSIAASVLYEDYGWTIVATISVDEAEQYLLENGLESEELALLLSMRLVLLLVLLVILALGLVLIVEYFYFRRTTERLEVEAGEDLLTGAYTRRAGTELLVEAFAAYQADHVDPSIIIFDVDHLKQINDSCGHSGGDQVLKGVVSAIRRSLGSSAKIIRWGGDEFVVVLYKVETHAVQDLCTKIVQSVSSLEFRFGEELIRPTISLGAAFFEPDDQSFLDAVNRADQALYQAKRSGKNRGEVYHGSTGES